MSETTSHPETAVAGPWRPKLDRRSLILAAMAITGGGMALNWGWLTAIGAAPLILAVAPCAVMCGLGVCMMCKSDSCDKKSPAEEPCLPRD
jgi:hypothetical protein